ncbi:putative retrotransposon protein [Tanacetum coccineum]
MATAAQNINNSTLRQILQSEKLTGPNFTKWHHNLRIALRFENKLVHLEQPLIPIHLLVASQAARDAYEILLDAQNEVACLMLGIKAFHACKQEDGQSVSPYLLKMKGYLDTLERLGYLMSKELGKDKKKRKGGKGKDKGKTKLAYAPKPKIPPPPKRENLIKDSVCHHYKEVGHWRRNFPSYHAELKKRKNASGASTSGIFAIELYAFPNKSWVYDTGCGTHICNTSQGLRESKKLKHGGLSLYMGNGMRAAVEAIRSFDLVLPSGLIIVLDKCYYAPTITRGVVLISCLVDDSYIHAFTNYGIYVSNDNVFYFNVIPRAGIYEIDMHDLYPNITSIYSVRNKRAKHTLDSIHLWHYRLGHINKKRIEKFLRDGILQPTHDESHEKCKSCISGKMARKPFPHQVERAKDLLGLIYTDVCSPLRTVSREGASYFITFTDDCSRYGFVYLMKHKHESFWGYALESTARILNMVPTKKVDRTPYEIWHRKALKMSYLRVWGCEALVIRDTPDKLDSRSIKYIFVGYLKESMGYYFYYLLKNKIFVARNTEFFENSLTLQEVSGSHRLLKAGRSDVGLELIQEDDTQPSKNISERHDESRSMTMRFGRWMSNLLFLNGHLSEDVYMVQHEGFVDPKPPSKICKLQRSIYGLKKASIRWNKRFDDEIKKVGFTQNPDELYLGEAVYILEIKITRDRSKWLIALSQIAYFDKILKKFKMENSKCGSVPMKEKPDYRKSQGAKTPSKVKLDFSKIQLKTVVKTILKSAKQSTIAMSSIEAEYIVVTEASMEAVWMRKFIDRLRDVMPSYKRPMKMLCDNAPAIAITNDPKIIKGFRHYQMKYHYIREVIQDGEIVLKKVHTNDNLADPFMKPMPYNKHFEHVMAIGVCPASSLM